MVTELLLIQMEANMLVKLRMDSQMDTVPTHGRTAIGMLDSGLRGKGVD